MILAILLHAGGFIGERIAETLVTSALFFVAGLAGFYSGTGTADLFALRGGKYESE